VVTAEALLLDSSLPLELDPLEDSLLDNEAAEDSVVEGVLEVVEDSVSVDSAPVYDVLVAAFLVSAALRAAAFSLAVALAAALLASSLFFRVALALIVLTALARRLAAATRAGSWPEASCT
jgi:hypothetical protein